MSDTAPKNQAALRHDAPTPAPAAPRGPGELLWSLRKDHRQIDCELRTHGTYGVEVQLLREREFYAGRMFPTREIALQWAEEERQAIEAS
jgi:hypothetical protein